MKSSVFLFFLSFLTQISLAQRGAATYESPLFIIEISEVADHKYEVQYLEPRVTYNEGRYIEELKEYEDIDSFLYALLGSLYALPDEKDDLLFFVHGMLGSRGDNFENNFDELKSAYLLPRQSPIGKMLMIKWPGNAYSYKQNRKTVGEIKEGLADVLVKLIRRMQILGFMSHEEEHNLHLICHSMGSYLLEQVMASIDCEQHCYPLFDNVVLAAADLDCIAFEEGQPLCAMQDMAQTTHVLVNENDFTLKLSSKLNGRKRLGLNGLSPMTILPKNIRLIDVSNINDETGFFDRLSKHSYYRNSPTITEGIMRLFQDGNQAANAGIK